MIQKKRCISHSERSPESRGSRTGAGRRHARRYNNFVFLLDLCDEEESNMSSPIFETCITGLSQLFIDEHKMKVWNDFINRTEEEQEQYLNGNDNDCEVDDDSWQKVQDNRNVHPAFSAQECFNRIEQKSKKFLEQENFEWNEFIKLENDILSFFSTWPNDVYVSNVECHYDKMLLEALCQYLKLNYFVYLDDNGFHVTQVENIEDCFHVPPITLAEYLKELRLQM